MFNTVIYVFVKFLYLSFEDLRAYSMGFVMDEVTVEYICFHLLVQCFSTAGGPVPGPGINYTGPREILLAWGNYNMLQDFISPVIDN